MKKSVELRKQLAAVDASLKALLDTAKGENRSFNDAEKGSFDTQFAEAEGLRSLIADAEKIESFETRMAANSGVSAPHIKSGKTENYSIVGHINAVRSGKLEGIYAEAQAEAVNELRTSGVAVSETANTVMIPSQRTFAASAATKGAEIVATEKVGLIESLFEGSLLQKVGANYMTGLVGNVDLPKVGSFDSAVWADENAVVAKKSGTIENVPLRPSRLAAPYVLSNLLLLQSSPSVDAIVRGEIQKKIQKALDEKFISYMLASTVSGTVVGGANGAALTYAKVLEFAQKVGESEADLEKAQFIINHKVLSALKQLAKGSTDNLVIADGRLDGHGYVASNRVPSDLVKGTGTALSAMLFGDFSSVVVGQWGGLMLTVDPYTMADAGATKLTVNSYFDIKDRYLEAKILAKDIVA